MEFISRDANCNQISIGNANDLYSYHTCHRRKHRIYFLAHPLLLLQLLVFLTMSFCSSALSSSSQLLKGKRVLVTGGGRGIGRAIALICHDEGANVVITSRTKSELEETIHLATTTTVTTTTAGDANEYEYDDEEKKLRLKQSTMATSLLSRRGSGKGKTASPGKVTSVGERRTGSASKARMRPSSITQLADAVKTGSSTVKKSSSSSISGYDEESCATNNRMVYYRCDVTNESEVNSMVQQIIKEEGEIDILINNAGGAQSNKGPVGSSALNNQDLENLLKLNVIGPQLVTSAICKHSWTIKSNEVKETLPSSSSLLDTRHQKVILNISSKAGKVGLQNYSFYVASKFALEGLTSSWSKELISKNIRVHSISPGMVNTKSFPKPLGKKGVRDAFSIKDCLLFALTGKIMNEDNSATATTTDTTSNPLSFEVDDMMKYTGHYIHVDEYDQVIREKGVNEAYLAWKSIDEVTFRL